MLFYLVNTLQDWLDQYVAREKTFDPIPEPELEPIEDVTDSEDEVTR